ncbi:MAG: hypothetical protein ACUVRT_02085 [Armatimonadota bacterium]
MHSRPDQRILRSAENGFGGADTLLGIANVRGFAQLEAHVRRLEGRGSITYTSA